jgi:hypothetical protein
MNDHVEASIGRLPASLSHPTGRNLRPKALVQQSNFVRGKTG